MNWGYILVRFQIIVVLPKSACSDKFMEGKKNRLLLYVGTSLNSLQACTAPTMTARQHDSTTALGNPFDGRCAISSSPKAAAFIVALTSNKAKRVQSWLAGLHARYVHCITTPRQLPGRFLFACCRVIYFSRPHLLLLVRSRDDCTLL